MEMCKRCKKLSIEGNLYKENGRCTCNNEEGNVVDVKKLLTIWMANTVYSEVIETFMDDFAVIMRNILCVTDELNEIEIIGVIKYLFMAYLNCRLDDKTAKTLYRNMFEVHKILE